MKIKVYTEEGYKIVKVEVRDDVKSISERYQHWEYVL